MSEVFKWFQRERLTELVATHGDEEDDTILFSTDDSAPAVTVHKDSEDTHDNSLRAQLVHTQQLLRQLARDQERDSRLIQQLSQKLEAVLLDNAWLRDERDSLLMQKKTKQGSETEANTEHNGGEKDSDANTCVVCLETPRTHALVPCGHFLLCGPCAVRTVSHQQPACPCCRQDVKQAIRIYHA